jgi:hypothetical protein
VGGDEIAGREALLRWQVFVDDMMLRASGVDDMTIDELREANDLR